MKINSLHNKKHKLIFGVSILILILLFLFTNRKNIFNDPYCTIIKDRNGLLLGAHIAKDGQYRFPKCDSVPYKFVEAITQYEDKRFFKHPGVDIFAIFRAMKQNISQFRIVSGGSTLSMQVIRLSRKGKSRNIIQKIIEAILALKLEVNYSKNEILCLYASHAPFGGNVVGIDAAAWRYFGRAAHQLTWSECAMLAVLPNNPAMVHPGKNRKTLLDRRNFVLKKLFDQNIIDEETYHLALEESLPEKPEPFPQKAPHLLTNALKSDKQGKQWTTLKSDIQTKTTNVLNKHYKKLSGNSIFNAAAIVIHNPTNETYAYVGNIFNKENQKHSRDVDVLVAPRSTGSVLKPILFAGMLNSGDILPDALVPDIPVHFAGYAPKNYNMGFDGAVKAKNALARSLNIPAVLMLKKYGIEKFHHLLKQIGLTTLTAPPSHYGLSLVLGGCEGKLYELAGMYSSMARVLTNYTNRSGKYSESDWAFPQTVLNRENKKRNSQNDNHQALIGASSLWFMFKAMLEVERPGDDNNWREFASSRQIAWKTGTSFGFRDAWAIGVTPEFTVGVWVGNADGEGRPELVGIKSAAPILFDIFDFLPRTQGWFDCPHDDLMDLEVCNQSGFLAGENCVDKKTMLLPINGIRFDVCPYHKAIHLDKSGSYRVNTDCESIENIIKTSWFILPPAMEWYYQRKNASYKSLPPFRRDCSGTLSAVENPMEIIYPKPGSKVYVPKEISGKQGKAIFEVAHRKPETNVFWYIDDEFIGQTQRSHKLEVCPRKGNHKLILVDENGHSISINFESLNEHEDVAK